MADKTFEQTAPFSVVLGTTNLRAYVEGNTIFWCEGFNDSSAGWNFTGVDLSEYERVRIEIKDDDPDLNLILCDGRWKNWHCYSRIAPKVFEAPLSGQGARWLDTDAHPINPKDGLMVMLQKLENEIRQSESRTLVKSIRFLKKNEDVFDAGEFGIFNRALGSIENGSLVKQNQIYWKKGNKDMKCGWNLVGVDLSEYKAVRIEFEKNDLELELTLADKNWQNWASFKNINPWTIEARFSGEGAAWKWNDFSPYDKSEGLLLFLRCYSEKPLKKDKKTIIKKIELVK